MFDFNGGERLPPRCSERVCQNLKLHTPLQLKVNSRSRRCNFYHFTESSILLDMANRSRVFSESTNPRHESTKGAKRSKLNSTQIAKSIVVNSSSSLPSSSRSTPLRSAIVEQRPDYEEGSGLSHIQNLISTASTPEDQQNIVNWFTSNMKSAPPPPQMLSEIGGNEPLKSTKPVGKNEEVVSPDEEAMPHSSSDEFTSVEKQWLLDRIYQLFFFEGKGPSLNGRDCGNSTARETIKASVYNVMLNINPRPKFFTTRKQEIESGRFPHKTPFGKLMSFERHAKVKKVMDNLAIPSSDWVKVFSAKVTRLPGPDNRNVENYLIYEGSFGLTWEKAVVNSSIGTKVHAAMVCVLKLGSNMSVLDEDRDASKAFQAWVNYETFIRVRIIRYTLHGHNCSQSLTDWVGPWFDSRKHVRNELLTWLIMKKTNALNSTTRDDLFGDPNFSFTSFQEQLMRSSSAILE